MKCKNILKIRGSNFLFCVQLEDNIQAKIINYNLISEKNKIGVLLIIIARIK